MIYYPHPILFSYGPFTLRYYGLFYAIGFILVLIILRRLLSRYKVPGLDSKALVEEQLLQLLAFGLIGGILFARIFYVLFYDLHYFLVHPVEIFQFWKGGLSFHGGLFGAVLFSFLYCKKTKIDFLRIADIVVVPISLALSLGRVGNFMNGELYGRVSSVPWAIGFATAPDKGLLLRHPSQIYEALKNLAIFFILSFQFKHFYANKKDSPKGTLLFSFMIYYGIARFFVEFFRQPDPQLGFVFSVFSMGQILSALLAIVGAILLFLACRKRNNNALH